MITQATKVFQVGDEVVICYDNAFAHYTNGKIVAISSNSPMTAAVELHGGSITTMSERYLILTAEVSDLREAARLERLKLEAEFEAIKATIDLKLEEASKLLVEANALASKHGKVLSREYHYEIGEIADRLGLDWQSSSSNC
jgi:hypothetical protein